MNEDVKLYHNKLSETDKQICDTLFSIITQQIPKAEYKIWHAHPVWFINENPIVGYHKLKNCVRLLFWSGQSFDEPLLQNEGSFKAAEIRYINENEVKETDLKRWLQKAQEIQWDYKNIVKRKGKLERLL